MKFIATILIALASAAAMAHPGGTNSFGCHTDSRTGIHHCH